jgi:pyruvate/2-oxoglutarate dehydrogenase complex dihydrolipoamide acyltransferase (E2) component
MVEERDYDAKQPVTERAEELVNRAGSAAGFLASLIGRHVAKVAAYTREEFADMWAEAQHLREQEGFTHKPEDQEPRSEQGSEIHAEAKAETSSAKAPSDDKQSREEPEEETEPVGATQTARRLAEELGVNLQEVEGTGKGNKVTALDVKKKAQAQS